MYVCVYIYIYIYLSIYLSLYTYIYIYIYRERERERERERWTLNRYFAFVIDGACFPPCDRTLSRRLRDTLRDTAPLAGVNSWPSFGQTDF